MQGVPEGGGPVVVDEVDREAARVRFGEPGDKLGRLVAAHCADELEAVRTSALNELWVEPDQVRAAVEVAGRDVVVRGRLEHVTQEVGGLVERVGPSLRVHLRPQCLDHLLPRRRELRPSQEEGQKRQHLLPNLSSADDPVADVDRNAAQIVDEGWCG